MHVIDPPSYHIIYNFNKLLVFIKLQKNTITLDLFILNNIILNHIYFWKILKNIQYIIQWMNSKETAMPDGQSVP